MGDVKHQGDKVKSGDIIAEIETQGPPWTSRRPTEGTIGQLLVPEGNRGPSRQHADAVILGEGEDAGASTTSTPRRGKPRSSNRAAATRAAEHCAAAKGRGIRATAEQSGPTGPREEATTAAETKFRGRGAATNRREPSPMCRRTEMVPYDARSDAPDAMGRRCGATATCSSWARKVAESQGADKVTQGLLPEFRPRRPASSYALTEHGLTDWGSARREMGASSRSSHSCLNFAMQAMDQIQLGRQDRLYVRADSACSIVSSRARTARPPGGGPAQPGLLSCIPHISGPSRDSATLRRPTPRAGSSRRSVFPSQVDLLENESSTAIRARCPRSTDYMVPIGQGQGGAAGQNVSVAGRWA